MKRIYLLAALYVRSSSIACAYAPLFFRLERERSMDKKKAQSTEASK